MSEEQKYLEDFVNTLVKVLSLPFTLPLAFDEYLVRSAPKEFAQPVEHMINARIEMLNAAKALADSRIKSLERARARLKGREVRKEKVTVK